MNANDAQFVRVYTREVGGVIADNSLAVSGGAHNFDVIVEAEAGSVLGGSGAPYQLSLTAFDWTTGDNAAPAGAFTFNVTEYFSSSTGTIQKWPSYEENFRVTLTAPQATALVGHVLQYTAVLISPPPGIGGQANIVSSVQSPLFVLI
jgi:hypothetical protein